MIVYHPIFDPYHCSFRLLLILTKLNNPVIEIERLRIYDFILLYPAFLYKMTLPKGFTFIRKNIMVNDYNNISSEKIVFARLCNMQDISMNALASTSLIDKNQLKEGLAVRTDLSLPQEILDSVANQNLDRILIVNFLRENLNKLSIRELKERTNLIEYRYDPN